LKTPTTIPKLASPLPSMQYATLLADGIDACQRLGGDQWTDFNEHDPGVTILEQLCYAITDASYRADLPLPDLVAGAPSGDTLVTGDRALSCDPVTADDWRKLLFSSVAGIRNVWVECDARNAFGPLYRVLVAPRDGADPDLRERVRAAFAAYRSIGEDLDSVKLLQPFGVELHGTLEIAAGANAGDVLAAALFAVQDYLSPEPNVQPVRDLAAAGMSYEAIFDGPLLEDGVIAGAQPPARRALADAQAIGEVLMGVEGVTAVRGLTLAAPGASGVRIAVPAGHVAHLEPSIFRPLPARTAWHLKVERHGIECVVDHGEVARNLQRRLAAIDYARVLARQQMANEPYRRLPKGRSLDLARYYSFQHHFPHVYGLGQVGVPTQGLREQARMARAMQARQLKAYLLLFDQQLADCFAQVGSLWKLLSLDPGKDASYFVQDLTAGAADDGAPNLREWKLLRAGPAAHASGDTACAAVHHVVYLRAGRHHPEIRLRSREVATREQAHRIEREMLQFGQHAHHYRQVQLIPGQFRLILDNGAGEAIAFGSEGFAGAGSAAREAMRLAALFRALVRDGALARTLLVPEEKGNASVTLVALDGTPLLSATRLTAAQQARCVRELLAHGAHDRHYVLRPRRDRTWRLFLCDGGGRVIAQADRPYASREDARRAVRHMTALAAHVAAGECPRGRHLHLVPPAPADDGDDAALLGYRTALEAIARKLDDFQARRNRFLDHLLARFGERFDGETLAGLDPRPAGAKQAFQGELIGWKTAFLRHCTSLGGARNRAGDGTRTGRSSLELRLYCLLGLLGGRGWEHLDGPERTAAPGYRYERRRGEPGAPASDVVRFSSGAPNLFAALLEHGIVRANYSTRRDGARWRVLFAWPGVPEGQAILETGSREEAERAIERTIGIFGRWLEQPGQLYAGEELLLVEHVLLRPADGSPCTDVGDDFFAYRLSLFFPAWPVRFQNPAFRRFAEDTVAENCPAHLAAHCHWLEAAPMAELKKLHGAWMRLKQAPGAQDRPELDLSAARLRRFVAALEAGGARA
jgi:hypothetical protein